MADQETKNPNPNEETETKAAAPEEKKAAKKPKGDAAKLAALEEQLAGEQAALAEAKDSLLRTAAEYDNYRKRSQKEHEAAFSNGVAHAAEQMLPILDVLNAAALAPTTDEEYKKGVTMTLAKCREVFKNLGIEEIDAEGKPFDPELHNACMQESCDGIDSGCVSKVVQKGYMLNGRVIRHAMVAVAP